MQEIKTYKFIFKFNKSNNQRCNYACNVNLRNVFMSLQLLLVVQVQGFYHSSEAKPEIVYHVI